MHPQLPSLTVPSAFARTYYRKYSMHGLILLNVQCQWVSLGVKEEQSSSWMKAAQEDIESGRPVTEIVGRAYRVGRIYVKRPYTAFSSQSRSY